MNTSLRAPSERLGLALGLKRLAPIAEQGEEASSVWDGRYRAAARRRFSIVRAGALQRGVGRQRVEPWLA